MASTVSVSVFRVVLPLLLVAVKDALGPILVGGVSCGCDGAEE